MTMIAIVNPSFNQVSETFVADHVCTLAPGRTVLVCQDGVGAERFGQPVLSCVNSDTILSGDRLRDTILPGIRRRFGHGPALAFEDRKRLAAFFRGHGVTVVLAEFGYSGTLVAEVCARLDLPLFVCFRGHDATLHKLYPSLRRRYRRLFRQAAGIIAESRFIAAELAAIGCPETLMQVIPSGVDPERFPPNSAEPGRILAIGRLVAKKAPDLSLRAFAQVAARFPQAHFDLVGDGALRGRCEALVAELNLVDRVTLHGYLDREACAALMRRAAMFIQHSVTDPEGGIEGFPVAIAEAMASALPVVSTRHSGIPEHVLDGRTGLLVAEGDVDGMAAAMMRLLVDPAAADRMGKAGREHALVHLSRAHALDRLRALMGLEMPGTPDLVAVR